MTCVSATSLAAVPPRPPLRPAPPPLEINTFVVVLIGMACWLIAFLVLLAFRDGHRLWLEVCVAGFGLGIIGLFLTRNRRPGR